MKARFSVIVEKEIVEKLDQEAKSRGLSRTKLVEKILAEYVGVKLNEDPSPTVRLQKEIEDLKKEIETLKKEIEALKSEAKKTTGIEGFMRKGR